MVPAGPGLLHPHAASPCHTWYPSLTVPGLPVSLPRSLTALAARGLLHPPLVSPGPCGTRSPCVPPYESHGPRHTWTEPSSYLASMHPTLYSYRPPGTWSHRRAPHSPHGTWSPCITAYRPRGTLSPRITPLQTSRSLVFPQGTTKPQRYLVSLQYSLQASRCLAAPQCALQTLRYLVSPHGATQPSWYLVPCNYASNYMLPPSAGCGGG